MLGIVLQEERECRSVLCIESQELVASLKLGILIYISYISVDICSILPDLTIRFSCYTTVAAVLCLQSTQNTLQQVTLKFPPFVAAVITY
jgi:hypothetical protein